jgi:hypothetical protein
VTNRSQLHFGPDSQATAITFADQVTRQQCSCVARAALEHGQQPGTFDWPIVEQPSVEPAVVEPAVVEAAVVEAAVVEPAVVEPAVVEPAVVEPAVEQP